MNTNIKTNKSWTAKNKTVDRSVEWGSTNSASVSDYITVAPDSDGSTNANITRF